MENRVNAEHWDKVYQTKNLTEVSWYQPTPVTSLDFLRKFDIRKEAKIIDVGGGDSLFVDHLLDLGYTDVTVLDISSEALTKAKKRLGRLADKVKWIVADAATFIPSEQYDFWHDRAAFHFLTEDRDVAQYIDTISKYISAEGVLVIGTFSEDGPTKCSGLDIKQYSEKTMTTLLEKYFKKVECITVDHKTPRDTIQNFVFCSFFKRNLK